MFTKDHKIWIIENYSPSEGLHQLRRSFISHFKPVNHKNVPLPHHFGWVVHNFKDTGSIQDRRHLNGAKPLSEVKVNLIKDHFEANPKSFLREASRDMNIQVATIQKTLSRRSWSSSHKEPHWCKPSLLNTGSKESRHASISSSGTKCVINKMEEISNTWNKNTVKLVNIQIGHSKVS